MKTLTDFKAKPYQQGIGSYVIVIPKSKFTEKIMNADQEYHFIVQEMTENESERGSL